MCSLLGISESGVETASGRLFPVSPTSFTPSGLSKEVSLTLPGEANTVDGEGAWSLGDPGF